MNKLANYENKRFGFSIEYPNGWSTGEQPTNGDGIELIGNSSDLKVSVWACHYRPESFDYDWYNQNTGFYDEGLVEIKPVTLNDGIQAKLKIQNQGRNTNISLLSIQNDIEYHADATVPSDYKDTIGSILETYNINK